MAAPTTGLVVIKKFPYRLDTTEEFSNKYLFSGTTPADDTAWRTLFDALVTEEKKCYPSQVSVIRGYGYNDAADEATAVWSVDLTAAPNTPVAGTLSIAGGQRAPGDCAVWVRWGTSRMVRGKRIYLRKYFHPAIVEAAGANPDLVWTTQTTALGAFGLKMRDGTFAGSRVLTDKVGSSLVGHAYSTNVTTRTLKRRGKRPPT